MDKKVEEKTCEDLLKRIGTQNTFKRKRDQQLRTQQRKRQNISDDPSTSGVSLSEAAVKTDDVSCLRNADDSYTINEESKNGVQEIGQPISFSTCELNNTDALLKATFQEDVELLLQACGKEYYGSRTPGFFRNKIESLHKNHIQVLLKEKDKCNKEFRQAQIKQTANRKVINQRLDTISSVLRSLNALNNCSLGLNLHKFIVEQRQRIEVIKSTLNDSVCCGLLRLEMKKDRREKNSIARKNKEIEDIRRHWLQTEIELKSVKIELEGKVNILKQHSLNEEKMNVEIRQLKVDVNTYKTNLAQTQGNLESVCKELLDVRNMAQQSLENNSNINSCMTETESYLQEAQKNMDDGKHFSKSVSSQPEGILENINNSKATKVFTEQVPTTRCQVQTFHKENCAIQKTVDNVENNNTEISELQTQQESENPKKILSSKIIITQGKVQNEKKVMGRVYIAEEDVKTLQNQLALTKEKLESAEKELDEVHIFHHSEQKEIELNKAKEVELLHTQLTRTQHTLDNVKNKLNGNMNIIQQKIQHEQKTMEQLNKAEEDKKVLQDQLTKIQNKLEDVMKNKEIELGKAKEVRILENQLTQMQCELEETRKCCDYKLITLTQKAQDEQKVMEQLNKAEESAKLHRSQLKATIHELETTKHELETLRKELNNTENSIREQPIEKAMASECIKIRYMLLKKLGFPNQCFKNYVKEFSFKGIVSDIRRLIEDKVQLQNETISETANGTNVLQVSEVQLQNETISVTGNTSNMLQVTENDVHLVITIACFLKSIPFSANTDFIYSFVAQIDNVIRRQHVESLLEKFPTIFKEEPVSDGCSNKKWNYLNLKPIITI